MIVGDKILIIDRWELVKLFNALFDLALVERSARKKFTYFKHAALISFLYSTAARPIEATWVKLRDVKFERIESGDEFVVVSIRCAKKRKKEVYRTVPIPVFDPVVKPFIFYVKQPIFSSPDDLLFPYSRSGTVLNILQQYGLGGYKLRHSRLTELAINGVDEYTLARIAGHKIPLGALEHYVTLMWQDIAIKVKIATEKIIEKAKQEGKYIEFKYQELIP